MVSVSVFCRLPLLRLPPSSPRLCGSAVQSRLLTVFHRLSPVSRPLKHRFSPFSPFSKNRQRGQCRLRSACCPLKLRLPNSAFRLDIKSCDPTFPAAHKESYRSKMHSIRQITTFPTGAFFTPQTTWVSAGKMFGPKPSFFPRLFHKDFPIHFHPFQKCFPAQSFSDRASSPRKVTDPGQMRGKNLHFSEHLCTQLSRQFLANAHRPLATARCQLCTVA